MTYLRAAAAQGLLNREHRRRHPDLPPTTGVHRRSSTWTNTNPAYRLGRLFAVLEKIQADASPGINATIRDRYYGAASSTPVAVFTTLLRLKNHHLEQAEPRPGASTWSGCSARSWRPSHDFPRHLTLPDQGRFALGYYHQRQAFFSQERQTAATTPATEEG